MRPERLRDVGGGGDFVFSRMRINVRFDDNGRSAHFFTFDIAKVPDGKRAAMLEACNAANKSFRWVSFYIDDDGDVNCDADAVLDAAGGGDACAEIVMRMVDIVNKSYVDFMRALWA